MKAAARICLLLILTDLPTLALEIDFPPHDTEVVVGQPASFGVIPRATSGLSYQWFKNGLVLNGATNDQIIFHRVGYSDDGHYSVVTSDGQTSATNSARLTVRSPKDGDVDFSFDVTHLTQSADFAPAAHIAVRQPDGKFILAGGFTQVNNELRRELARLNADGTTDMTFMDGTTGIDADVTAVALQPDGKLVVAGYFSRINSEFWNRGIARLNRDGSIDRTFQPSSVAGIVWGWTQCLAIQSDGKILGGLPSDLYRLNPDGSLDQSFQRATLVPGIDPPPLSSLGIQMDGKILVGLIGDPGLVGTRSPNLLRVNENGTLDAAFISPPITNVSKILQARDGKMLIAAVPTVTRLNFDGTVDNGFLAAVRLSGYPSADLT